jgi:hypothetical protein
MEGEVFQGALEAHQRNPHLDLKQAKAARADGTFSGVAMRA